MIDSNTFWIDVNQVSGPGAVHETALSPAQLWSFKAVQTDRDKHNKVINETVDQH